MVSGSDEPDPEEGKILSPNELDIDDDEHVTEIGDGRYVVSPDVRTDESPESQVSSDSDSDPESKVAPETDTPDFTDANVHEWLDEQMMASNSRYGFDVTAKFDGTVDQQRVVSNDIITAFESFMLWYGRQMDGSTPVADVLGILICESNVPVKHPPESVKEMIQSNGLSPDDSIADLLEAIEARDGAEF